MIPGLGRSPGEGIGYPLQYSWASLVAQLVNNPPAMSGRDWGQEEKGMTEDEMAGWHQRLDGHESE